VIDSGGDITMTMQAEQLSGARLTGSDGQVVGIIQSIFNDDTDGTPVWARVKAGTHSRFVPLAGGKVTADGLTVPYSTQQIMTSPEVSAERHMSYAQTDQLRRHFGLAVPAQGGPPDMDTQTGEAQGGAAGRGQAQDSQAQDDEAGRGQAEDGKAGRGQAQDGKAERAARPAEDQRGGDWLIRAEERVNVGTETMESGRARLHKYVDVEPVEQAVRVYHEEYEIERVPITADEQIHGVIAEAEQEIILHEERPVFRKESVPVERVRLVVKRVEEDRTLRDEIRKERVEVEPDGDGRGRTH
jgi:stress response protein YsnF